ncbi:MAG: ATP-dependent RecD-like DNA helicase, partial [Clostridia bacterium]|nr:ATP-dependent RecD-like DNA helicase [Clostridia bacterium]
EKTAQKIVEAFGDKAMEVLRDDPLKLSQIKGISTTRAMEIGNSFAEHIEMQQQIMFLQGFGIGISTAVKIFNTYKENTERVLTKNPYKLIDDIDGIGFLTADKIAQKMGIPTDSLFRVRAGVVYSLQESAEKSGNTFLFVKDIANYIKELLQLDEIDQKALDETIDNLQFDLVCRVFNHEGERCIALSKYFKQEKTIAGKIVKKVREIKPLGMDTQVFVEEFERINGIKFHDSQKDAINSAVNCGVTIITGGPGTGKTTIIKCISYIFESLKLRVEYCTPTGRASKRLSESTGREAKTIHRLLGMKPSEGVLKFNYNAQNPLPADVVIVDELSMADVNVMYHFINALNDHCRIVLVGDKDQLPSVGAGNVLADLIASKIVEVKYLTHIYRQEEGSFIVTNAHLINNGKMPIADNANSKDFFVNYKDNQQDVLDTVLTMVSQRLPSYLNIEPSKIQVLCPLKGGIAGINNLNIQLQRIINPPTPTKKELKIGNVIYREGDKVMQIKNNYDQTWSKLTDKGLEEGEGVFNGDIGRVVKIEESASTVVVLFEDGRQATYDLPSLDDLTLAYAITVHKSQGSEFEVLLIAVNNGPPTILSRNLLYTAVTRAKRTVVLVCGKKTLGLMVHNNYVKQRTTMLKKFLKEESNKYDLLFGGKYE